MTPPRGVEDAAPYILGREPSANRRGGLPPSLAPLVRHPSTPPRRGRACPARSLASAPGFVLHPFYLLHRREGLRGCEQGPRLSGAKPGCEQCLPLRGKQPHERVSLQTGGARCAPPSARPAALPLLQLCRLCAGAGFISPGHVSFDADFSFCSVGRGLDPSAELPKNACRGEHCSPVPVCLARKPSRKMRCGGKWAGDQWSPLHTQ